MIAALETITDVGMDAISRAVDTNHRSAMSTVAGLVGVVGIAVGGGGMLMHRVGETSVRSRAATTVSDLRQIADAVSVHDVQATTPLAAGDAPERLVATGFLTAVPANPTGGGAPMLLDADGSRSPRRVAFVAMPIGGADAEATCRAIATATRTPVATSLADARAQGCARSGTSLAAYARIG